MALQAADSDESRAAAPHRLEPRTKRAGSGLQSQPRGRPALCVRSLMRPQAANEESGFLSPFSGERMRKYLRRYV